jgi:CxxC motif-containing protein (DUF1111 family)
MNRNSNARGLVGSIGRTALIFGAGFAMLCSLAHPADRVRRPQNMASRDWFEGKFLFEKQWEAGAPSPTGGDGLGPLYNENSCVGCHHLGGTGGGAKNEHNVILLTAVAGPAPLRAQEHKVFSGALEELHPGFRSRASVVLHRHATNPESLRKLHEIESIVEVKFGENVVSLRQAQRNTPALFGAGLIDAIPDKVLRDAEKSKFEKFPEIHGRASELPDGRLGRFGWKAQIATLGNFVKAACANELGLEVPGQRQASLAPSAVAELSEPTLDLDEGQCEQLTRYVAQLAPPARRFADDRHVPPWGLMVFQSTGCAACHLPKLGDVKGIYSDLLLHDMGEDSSDSATYYGAPIAPARLNDLAAKKEPARPSGMATATEWRTAPLWGVADSAPFLHDGRASTLEEAIRLHGGEAAKTAARYARLSAGDRKAVLSFLSSLTVSPQPKPRKTAAMTRRHARAGIRPPQANRNRGSEGRPAPDEHPQNHRDPRLDSAKSVTVFTGVF